PWGLPGFAYPGYAGLGLGTPWALPGAALPAVAARADAQRRTMVTIQDNFFLPAEITVPVGTTVTWTNRGRVAHTSTDPGVWDSGRIAPGQTFSAVFAIAGTFDYVCSIHPEMRGRVNVQALAEDSAAAPAAVARPAAVVLSNPGA